MAAGTGPCDQCGSSNEPLRYVHHGRELCWNCFSGETEPMVTTFGDPPLQPAPKPRSKGTLPHLPNRDTTLSELRGWLTRAFAAPTGYTFDGFERHGRRLSDPAWLILRAPTGDSVRYRFPEQRALARPGNLRSSVVSLTDGLCRMGPITNPEAADVWVALCSIAHVVAAQDEVEEFREHVDTFLQVAETESRYTLEPKGRFDTLVHLQARGSFERRHARLMVDDINERNWDRRPIRLLDSITAAVWVRVGELGTYLRHVLGLRLDHGTLDGRMSELGATRVQFEVRNGTAHPKASLYRLAGENEPQSPSPH